MALKVLLINLFSLKSLNNGGEKTLIVTWVSLNKIVDVLFLF